MIIKISFLRALITVIKTYEIFQKLKVVEKSYFYANTYVEINFFMTKIFFIDEKGTIKDKIPQIMKILFQ